MSKKPEVFVQTNHEINHGVVGHVALQGYIYLRPSLGTRELKPAHARLFTRVLWSRYNQGDKAACSDHEKTEARFCIRQGHLLARRGEKGPSQFRSIQEAYKEIEHSYMFYFW